MRTVLPFIAFLFLFTLTGCFGSQRPAPVTHFGKGHGPGSAGVHNVISGDTLWSVSKRYNIPMSDIALANELHAPFTLEAGQRLVLPPPQKYRVRPGDSLYSVSRLFNVSASRLAGLNSISAPYRLRAGQVLLLPYASREGLETVAPAPTINTAMTPEPRSARMAGLKSRAPLPITPEILRAPEKTRPQKKAPVTAKTPPRSSGRFLKPLQGTLLSSYGPKSDGRHNDGINIAAPRGTPVRAAENGVIVYAGDELRGSGNLILIRHEDRWMTAYAHLDKISVKRGDVVSRGQTIGTVGSTGSVDSPQLHFELRRGTEAINPKKYLES